ncbi:MAG: UDP-N-acetylmuramoyl-tripeptide--D-alanyl-D-alanine ligase [Rhodospirillaceae bacterium]|nr:UDP-N-acetylmuramoyl-tripeptide--D-alanyl-D-alanine ligase [Rhodospirillaceae bacterium]MBT5308361.1 UDP-N-acetylmuramoyl-tripeptide--D-alanyl-D-alanine ligase [Rhodospirillaceae bacterium]MBT6406302.1 UDP-N-acetylmuramoyl-tripeptide--D-alanyl-D-alanine ligase [Rhodospirillaceae bacterium]MBT7355893.1 UDP-N-acetylmuramoyl-tripeptide--D-alanyl-D-alanine ligase [Rhodospirillaceae bacterium]
MKKQPLWTSVEAPGTSSADWQASGVSIDTRTLEKGDLFVALHGPNFDGHEFATDAEARGAAAIMVDRDVPGLSIPVLRVDDTMAGLEDLARAARQRSNARIIAITGSVGKTGTKEALNYVLSAQAPTAASIGNLNNQWGLPLSLARMPKASLFGVFEMGMNHPGEINPLSRLARPHVVIITTVEDVHSAHFQNVEEIADAKAEIFAGMEPDGIAVLNMDNPHFHRLAAAAKAKGVSRILSFGSNEEADFRLLEETPDYGGMRVEAQCMDNRINFRLGVPGHHWAVNSLGVLASVAAVGGSVGEATVSMAGFHAPKGRGDTHVVPVKGGQITVIDESYNASPVSMCAVFRVLGQLQPGQGGRRIAALGDMLELGDDSAERHAALADALEENDIDLVFTAGSHMASLDGALSESMRGGHADNSTDAIQMLTDTVQAGDIVLVKGSAGSRMGLVVDALLNLADGSSKQAGGGR